MLASSLLKLSYSLRRCLPSSTESIPLEYLPTPSGIAAVFSLSIELYIAVYFAT